MLIQLRGRECETLRPERLWAFFEVSKFLVFLVIKAPIYNWPALSLISIRDFSTYKLILTPKQSEQEIPVPLFQPIPRPALHPWPGWKSHKVVFQAGTSHSQIWPRNHKFQNSGAGGSRVRVDREPPNPSQAAYDKPSHPESCPQKFSLVLFFPPSEPGTLDQKNNKTRLTSNEPLEGGGVYRSTEQQYPRPLWGDRRPISDEPFLVNFSQILYC